jgi:hypothetical protein
MDFSEHRLSTIEKKLDNMTELLEILIKICNNQEENNIQGFKLICQTIKEVAAIKNSFV